MKYLLAFLLLICSSFALTVSISDCGSYTMSAVNPSIVSITADINVNDSSTITNGACVYIEAPWTSATIASASINFNGHSISYLNGSATYAILIKDTHIPDGGNIPITFNNLTTISNFTVAIGYEEPTPHSEIRALVSSAGNVITANNCLYAIKALFNVSELSNDLNVSPCNTTYPFYFNVSDTSTGFVFNAITSPSCKIKPQMTTDIDGVHVFTSPSGLAFTGRFVNWTYTATSTSSTASYYAGYDNFVYLGNPNQSYDWYLSDPIKLISWNVPTNIYSTSASNSSGNGTWYYCALGTECNSLYFKDGFQMPFFISAVGSSQVYTVPSNWVELQLWSIQGASKYLVYSSNNNSEMPIYLVGGGTYEFYYSDGVNNFTGRNFVQCGIYPPCSFILANNSNAYGFNYFSYNGNCLQMNTSDIECMFYTQDGNLSNWTMIATNISNISMELCRQFSNASTGILDCQLNESALVVLYHDGAVVSTATFTVAGITGNFWYIIYAGISILLIFVVIGVPLILPLVEMTVTYLFYMQGLINVTFTIGMIGIWSVLLIGIGVNMFKKGS